MQSLAPETHRWIRAAADVELARAHLEDPEAFRPEALCAIREEVARRGLDCELVLAAARRRRRKQASRQKKLCGGLVLAGLGLVQAFWPRPSQVELEICIDNPGDDRLDARMGDLDLTVPPGATQRVHLVQTTSRIPAATWLRVLQGHGGSPESLSLELWLRRGGGESGWRGLRPSLQDGGRYLVAEMGGYVVEEQRYRPCGRVAVRAGRVRREPLGGGMQVLDLEQVPFPGRGPVAAGPLGEAFPPVLELPEGRRDAAGLLRRYRIRRR